MSEFSHFTRELIASSLGAPMAILQCLVVYVPLPLGLVTRFVCNSLHRDQYRLDDVDGALKDIFLCGAEFHYLVEFVLRNDARRDRALVRP